MCFDERNTERRGRPLATRRSFARTRRRRRRKRAWALSDIGLLFLAFLAADRLRRIFDAFTLVRLRRAEGADLGSDLTDPLTVGPAYGNGGRSVARDLDIAGDRISDFVTVAELQVEPISLDRGAIADTIDFERDREPFRHPGHHVANQRTRCSPHR